MLGARKSALVKTYCARQVIFGRWLIFILPMVLVVVAFGVLNGVLLTSLLGWLSLLLVLLLIAVGIFVAALTRGGLGVVNMSPQELRAWMSRGE